MKTSLPLALAAFAALAIPGAFAAEPASPAPMPVPPYKTDELSKVVNPMISVGGRSYAGGEKVFQTIGCTLCHHFGGGEGGIGPDLTGVGGRMGTRAILESILEPSKEISDLVGFKTITKTDGKTVSGRWDPEASTDDTVGVMESYLFDANAKAYTWDGAKTTYINREDIASIDDSKVSPMTPGLINGLKIEEIADLVAYLISGGNPEMRMFKPAVAPAPAARPATSAAAPTKQ